MLEALGEWLWEDGQPLRVLGGRSPTQREKCRGLADTILTKEKYKLLSCAPDVVH